MKRILLPLFFVLLSTYSISFAQITSVTGKANWSVAATWVGGVVPTATDNVIIADGATITLDGAFECANLTVGSGVSGILNTSKTVVCTLIVHGNVLCNAGSSFVPQSSGTTLGSIAHTVIVYGNFQFDGTPLTGFNLRSGSATKVPATIGVLNFEFAGTSNSTISGSTYSPAGNGFNVLKINKTGGAKVILGSTVFILPGSASDPSSQSQLNFVSGVVETGANALVHQKADITNVIGVSNSCYVVGNYGTALNKTTKTFPVGDASGYRPITISSTDTAGQASASGYHWVTAGVVSGNANTGSSALSSDLKSVSSVRYYKINYNQGTTTVTQMGFNKFNASYGADDGVTAGNTNLRVAYSADERATWTGMTQLIVPHTTDLSNPPTTIIPDSLTTSVVSVNAGTSIYVALATAGGTSVEQESGIAKAFALSQNFPNPFNPSTSISFSIPQASLVSLKVYDVLGKEVASLLNETKNAGNYKVNFDASKLSTGLYIYRLVSANSVLSKKMLLVK